MVFLRYESFREYIRFYPVTTAILALNVLMFIIVSLSSLPETAALIKYGAIVNFQPIDPLRVVIQPPELHTYVTSIFLHGGVTHLLFNSFATFVFAPPLERMLGHVRYAVLYLISGIAGNVLSEVIYSHVLKDILFSVGASGSVYGVFGAYLYIVLNRKDLLDYNSRKTVMMILALGAIYPLIGYVIPGIPTNINWYAHLGGLVAGFALIGLFLKFRYNRR